MATHIDWDELQASGVRVFVNGKEYWVRPAQTCAARLGVTVMKRGRFGGWQYVASRKTAQEVCAFARGI